MWTYKGIDIYPADRNSSGIRWYARTSQGNLRTDTKEGMKQMINERIVKNARSPKVS